MRIDQIVQLRVKNPLVRPVKSKAHLDKIQILFHLSMYNYQKQFGNLLFNSVFIFFSVSSEDGESSLQPLWRKGWSSNPLQSTLGLKK